MRTTTVGKRNPFGYLFQVQVKYDNFEARVTADPYLVGIRVRVQGAVIAAHATRVKLVQRSRSGNIKCCCVDDAEHFAAIVRFFTFTDRVYEPIIPSEVSAVRTVNAGTLIYFIFFGFHIDAHDDAVFRTGYVGCLAIRGVTNPNRCAVGHA